MNADVKTVWLEALRSGKYPQGRGMLRTQQDEFCCLGVLCDLAKGQGVVDMRSREDLYAYTYMSTGSGVAVDSSSSVLPVGIALDWAGLDEANPYLPDGFVPARPFDRDLPEEPFSLAELNDNGYTFAEIADLIEEYL